MNDDEMPAEQTMSIDSPAPEGEPAAHRLTPQDEAAVDALPPGSALLIVHSGPNAGARFLLDQEVTVAGRSVDGDIFLDDVTVSREHVRFERKGTEFHVVDAGSLNGTYVNRERIVSKRLEQGDEVQIGKYRLTFYPGVQ
jgi:pSer/pThr/pTyr-binding forkhead associated (FHA) protein